MEGEYEPCSSSADVMIARDSHSGHRVLRPLRGRAVIAVDPYEAGRDKKLESGVWIPATARHPRSERIHQGKIVALGDPAETPKGHMVPWGCAVGDVVLFVYVLAMETHRSMEFSPWGPVVVVAQSEIQAVLQGE